MTLRVLILDDDEDRHDAYRKRLADAQRVHVYTYADCKRALDELPRFDVASLDYDLNDFYLGPYGANDEYTGQNVAKHIAHMPTVKRPRNVVIHSWNPDGARRMALILAEVGLISEVSAFELREGELTK